jgi:hypothetical protein
MPVTFAVADVIPRPVFKASQHLRTPGALLNAHISRFDEPEPGGQDEKNANGPPPVALLQSSFVIEDFISLDIRCERNGFVQAVTHAYNQHHHLKIRPDDVWIAILSQLSIYINKNSEKLRSQFVRHEGKKKLTVSTFGTRHTADFGDLAKQMTQKIDETLINPGLKSWILPDFTTTTPNDTVVCSIMMMATMKAYTDYEMTMCGLPSVTLEGERSDWENIYKRIDMLETFGDEPKAWATFLRPVLRRFASSFDEPDIDFWNKISHHYSLGSGTRYLSGWITAFCVWNNEGQWQGNPLTEPVMSFGEKLLHPKLELDGIYYPSFDVIDVPMGFCEVDVKVIDNQGEADCVMVAGHMANLVEGRFKDTLRPMPAWFMYVKPDPLDDDEVESLFEKDFVSPFFSSTWTDTLYKLYRILCY